MGDGNWLTRKLSAVSRQLDERVNLKFVHRRLQAVAKVLIVTTFFEDALRVLLTFSVQQNSMRIAGWRSPALHTGLPVFSFVVQMLGALLVALPGRSTRPAQVGVGVLLTWCCFHPIMYSQYTNWEFVLETLTIMGGLLILLSHCILVEAAAAARASPPVKEGEKGTTLPRIMPAKAVGVSPKVEGVEAQRAHAVAAVGRALLTSVFLYYAANKVHGYAKRVGQSVQAYDLATPAAEGLMIVVLLYLCSLVIVGIQSRWVALLLALLMALSACWMHPFWVYILSTKHYKMEGVAHMEGYEVDGTPPPPLPPHRRRNATAATPPPPLPPHRRRNATAATPPPPLCGCRCAAAAALLPLRCCRSRRPLVAVLACRRPPLAHDAPCPRAAARCVVAALDVMCMHLCVAAFTMGDHQRYFFFQTMSTVGALLLLVVHGPGKLSMDEQQGQLVLITTHDA